MVGVVDIPVLPPVDGDGTPLMGHVRKPITHNNYWSLDPTAATEERPLADGETAYHIAALRDALRVDQVPWTPKPPADEGA